MKAGAFLLFAFPVLCFLAPAIPASAATSNPYNGIIDRNVFSLKAPEPPAPPGPPPAPPVKLTLTGITTILGNKRALLKAQVPPHPPEPAKEESYMLTEGQRDGGVEVLSIDERGGIVKVNNNGQSETLDFVNNGAKTVATAATPGVVGLPGNIPAPIVSQSGGSISGSSGAANGQMTAGMPRTAFPTGATPTSTPTSASGPSQIPINPFGPSAHQIEMMDPEAQTIMIEAQRIHYTEQGDSTATILPPTELTPTESPLPQ